MAENFDYSDLTLHGRFTEDGTQFRLYVLLNGEEVPVQYLNVHDYRERFDAAKQAGQNEETSEQASG